MNVNELASPDNIEISAKDTEAVLAEDERVIYRDPDDVQMLHRCGLITLILTGIAVISCSLNIWLALRPPQEILVSEAGQIIAINGKPVHVDATPDQKDTVKEIFDSQKKYLVTQFLTRLYEITPETREKDLRVALKAMMPGAAKDLLAQLKPVVEKERAENWHATFQAQEVKLDDRDPYLLRAIGTQELKRSADGTLKPEKRLLAFTFKLMSDPRGRQPENLNSGYQIAAFEESKLPATN